MKTRRREPPLSKLNSHHSRRAGSSGTSLQEAAQVVQDVAPPPSFTLTGSEIAQAARRAAERGTLTGAEAAAIAEVVQAFGSTITGSYELLARPVKNAFHRLVCATTPDRAYQLAWWTPFSPERLLEASKCQARGAA